MAQALKQSSLRITAGAGLPDIFTTNKIKQSASNEGLVAFAETIVSLTDKTADKFVKKNVFQITS